MCLSVVCDASDEGSDGYVMCLVRGVTLTLMRQMTYPSDEGSDGYVMCLVRVRSRVNGWTTHSPNYPPQCVMCLMRGNGVMGSRVKILISLICRYFT